MSRKFWIGLLVILIVYTAYNFAFVETSYIHDYIPRKIRHLIKFSILMLVYLMGLYNLSLNKVRWMKTIWHLVHVLGIFFLLTFGVYDWLIQPLQLPIKLFLISINEFLVAPTLFITMGLLDKFLVKNNVPKN